jgi:hypothetical protein
LALLAGCQGGAMQGIANDPLLGPGRPTQGPTSLTSGGGGVPPLPANHAMTSPAALAGGPAPQTDAGRDLRSGGAPGANPYAAPSWSQSPPRPGQAGLSAPELSAPAAGTPLTATSATSPGVAPMVPLSDAYAQVQEALRARRVSAQRLETSGDAGEWHFWCAIPRADNPNLRTNYEAKAVGENGLAAMRAVIEEIDRANKAAGR